ncbi:MAG: membrane protein insertion efficiency factor YidD [Alphaproteobacteria bacterium]
MVRFFQWLIRGYSWLVSPFLGKNCRYSPTCSSYMCEALDQHGVLKGLFLGWRRILSCHPYSKKKHNDPVPKQFAWKDVLGYKRLCCKRHTHSEDR